MSWTGKNDLKTLRVDVDIFENGRKICGHVWTGTKINCYEFKEG